MNGSWWRRLSGGVWTGAMKWRRAFQGDRLAHIMVNKKEGT